LDLISSIQITNKYAVINAFSSLENCHKNPFCQKFAKSRFDLVGHCSGRSDGAIPSIAPWSKEARSCGAVRGDRQHPEAAVC
jgi:hypothetical protein